MCGFIAQLVVVEHRTSIAEVTGSNPIEAQIFFRLLLSNCLNWKIYCNDHSSLSSITAVKYELFHIYFTSSFVDKMMKGISSSFISFICFNICTFAFLLPLRKADISDFPQTQSANRVRTLFQKQISRTFPGLRLIFQGL